MKKRKNIQKMFCIFLLCIIATNLFSNIYALEISRSNTYDLNHLEDKKISKDSLEKDNLENSKNINTNVSKDLKKQAEDTGSSMITGLFSFSSSSFIVLCIIIAFIVLNIGLHILHTK